MNKNQAVLKQFVAFCEANPDLRFWQALRAFCGANFIFVADNMSAKFGPENYEDTFYWEGINE